MPSAIIIRSVIGSNTASLATKISPSLNPELICDDTSSVTVLKTLNIPLSDLFKMNKLSLSSKVIPLKYLIGGSLKESYSYLSNIITK